MPLIVPTVCTLVLDSPDAFYIYFERFYCSQTFQLERCSIGLWRGCNDALRGRILSRCGTKYRHPGYDPSRKGSVSHTFGVPCQPVFQPFSLETCASNHQLSVRLRASPLRFLGLADGVIGRTSIRDDRLPGFRVMKHEIIFSGKFAIHFKVFQVVDVVILIFSQVFVDTLAVEVVVGGEYPSS